MRHSYRFLAPIAALFTATLLISNTLDTKIFAAFGLDLPAGITLFPLAYIFGDVLTEVYGYAKTRQVIWTGFAGLILMILFYEVARALPPAQFWPYDDAFRVVLGHVPRIVLASICAYFCGEFCNSYVLAKLKVKTKGRAMAIRFVASTIIGQLIDTAVFVVIAFSGRFGGGDLLSIFLSGWFIKVGWEVIALPITLPFVGMLKRLENEDYFDRDTNFSPFIFG